MSQLGRPEGLQVVQVSPAQAMWRGAVTAGVVVFPVGILNQFLIDTERVSATSPVVFLLWVLIMLGAAAGGWATIRMSRDAALAYAAGAAAIAYVAVQAIGVIRRLITGGDISWLAYPMLCMLLAICGALGGQFARRWQAPPSSSDTDEGN